MSKLRSGALASALLWPLLGGAQSQPQPLPELAFVSLRDGEAQIYRRDSKGVVHPVTRGPGYSMHPAWSAEGQWAYAQFQGTSTRVFICDFACQSPRRISDAPDWQERSPSWAPDGRSLAYVARPLRGGDTELRLLNLTTGESSVLLKSRNGFGPDPVSWSSDGRLLAVIAAGVDRTPHVWLIDRNNAQVTNLSESLFPQGVLYAQLSPDGRHLAWVARRKGRNPVMLTALASLETRDLMPGQALRVESPRWSPDGQKLVLAWRGVDTRLVNADIAVLSVADGHASVLTEDPAEDFDPRWSADGSSVVFASLRTGTSLLYEADLRGGPNRAVSEHKSHDMDAVPRNVSQATQASSAGSSLASIRNSDSTH